MSAPAYRLARKKTLDAVAQLSGAIRRLADEPNTNRRALAALNELLAANYLLASDLSSMPVLVKLRAAELDAGRGRRGHRRRARAAWWRCCRPAARRTTTAPVPPREGLSGTSMAAISP